ncbi:MAG: hypothetical protein COY42_22200 [Armatimonadetes bacterium CG_4_10_14_0_8_um_filter_66_14]|nr:MAG: hypothetical protein COY42_22200 [Armatimonadetes bacterium CG_4_10_14_0_8_um_filter_66_14]
MRGRWICRHTFAVTLASAVACVTIAWAEGDDSKVKVKEGDPAPGVELQVTQIETVLPERKGAKTLPLADRKGKNNVVLYFYPKAMTGG